MHHTCFHDCKEAMLGQPDPGCQVTATDLSVRQCLCRAAGGTFALYSLIARYAHISTPSGGSPNSSDLHLSRYTSNSMIENSQRHGPRTVAERVRKPHGPITQPLQEGFPA